MPRILAVAAHLAALLGGTFAAFHPTLLSGFARVQAEEEDGPLNHYLLEHSWRCVGDSAYRGSFVSPPFFHPQPYVLGYSENLIGVAPFYWMFRFACPEVLAYQLWLMLVTALTYLAWAWVLRKLGLPLMLAVAGGYLSTFAMPHLQQLAHPQLAARFWMPFALLGAWRFAERPQLRALNRTLFFAFLQGLSCIYTGWFLALGLLVFVPAALAANGTWRDVWRMPRLRLVLLLLAWGLVAASVAVPYRVATQGQIRYYSDAVPHIPTASAYFASADEWYYPLLRPWRNPVSWECQLFAGFGLYVLSAVALVAACRHRRTREGRFVLAGLATATLLVLFTANVYDIGSAWYVVRYLPGGQALRAVGRAFVAVHWALVPAMLVGVRILVEANLTGWRRHAAYVVVAAAVIAEQAGFRPPSFDANYYARAREAARDLHGDALYLTPEFADEPIYTDTWAMWVGLYANVPVVNGYSGRKPDGYPAERVLTEARVRAWLGPEFRGRLVYVDRAKPGHFPGP